MHRRAVVIGALALAIATLVAIQPARAAARGAECNIAGAAKITPGLSTKAGPQKVTLSNVKLTNCRIGSTAAAGVPKTISGSVSVLPNPASGSGSCAQSALNGLTATITWSTGKVTKASFSTKSVTGETVIQGKVLSSTDTNLRAGDLVEGDVVFKPTTTAQNCVTVPVTAVTFTGVLATGSPK
jgi:hypothetical protein